MSNNYRPQGSEKIQDADEKLARIKIISGIGQKPAMNEEHNRLNTKFSTVLHEAVAADGQKYGLVQEGSKVHLKRLVNDHYEFLTGDEKDYAYKDFSTAFKQMNFLFKDISQRANHADPINIFEGGMTEKKNLTEKFVLKTPQAQAPVSQDVTPPAPAEGMPPAGDQASPAMPAPDPQASQQLGQEIGNVEGQVEDQDPAKAMQKMVGKLTEKMRTADEQIMTSEFMKSILNSVISAMDVKKLEDPDLLSVVKKLKGGDNPEQAGDEAQPSGADDQYTNPEGIDYNVNNPANSESEPPVKEQHPLAGILDGEEGQPTPNQFRRGVNRAIQEELSSPTWDDQVLPDILQQVLSNNGFEMAESNMQEITQAVAYFINAFGGDQNQTEFMQQLQTFVKDSGVEDIQVSTLKYSDLGQMGMKIVDDLEILDPNMGGDMNDSQQNSNVNFQTAPSNSPALSFTSEGRSFLMDKILEAISK